MAAASSSLPLQLMRKDQTKQQRRDAYQGKVCLVADAFELSGVLWPKVQHTKSADEPGTVLWLARTGDLEGLQQAVSAGADPRLTVDKHGLDALQWAAGAGHIELVVWLLTECKVTVRCMPLLMWC